MRRQSVRAQFLILALLLAFASSAFAYTNWYVDGKNGSDGNNCKSAHTACKRIKQAIALSSSGDTILVAPSVYDENLLISMSLEIIGAGADTTIIDGGYRHTVVTVANETSAVVLGGFTIRHGGNPRGSLVCGGGVGNVGNLVIFDTDIKANITGNINDSEAEGGGICNDGILTLNNSIVEGNLATESYVGYGGGISNNGSMVINDSTISRNTMETTDEYGAGIFNVGTLTVNRSTISGNLTAYGSFAEGGGIYNGREATLNNTTFYKNSCPGCPGGAIDNTGTITINNNTIVDNAADIGAGIFAHGTYTVLIQNTIVARNAAVMGEGANCAAVMTSNGYNLSNDASCNFDGPGDLKGIPPRLGPLRNNGGPTQTMAELPGSPTIEAGNPEFCLGGDGYRLTSDQRGAPRPGKSKQTQRCDIGAFERQKD